MFTYNQQKPSVSKRKQSIVHPQQSNLLYNHLIKQPTCKHSFSLPIHKHLMPLHNLQISLLCHNLPNYQLPSKQSPSVPASKLSPAQPNWIPLLSTPSCLPSYKKRPSLRLGKRPATQTCDSPCKKQPLSCSPSDNYDSHLPDPNQLTPILSTSQCGNSVSGKTLPTVITANHPHTAPSVTPPIHFKCRYCNKSFHHKSSLSKHTKKEHSHEQQRGSIHCHLCPQR